MTIERHGSNRKPPQKNKAGVACDAATRSVGESLRQAVRFLEERGVPEAAASAEFLMSSVLRAGRGEMLSRGAQTLDEKRRRQFQRLVSRRSRRLPLAYVLGSQDFMGLEFEVTADVLVPRPETEGLVECILSVGQRLARGLGRGLRILDLGTGSGCIALTLASRWPDSFVAATDASRQALNVAAKNAQRLGLLERVRFIHADLFEPGPDGAASWTDIVVSNPPYIPSGRIPSLDPEVLCEPRLALDGGKDGLDAIRAIIAYAPRLLRPGGWLVLEMDEGQGRPVRKLCERDGFIDIEIRRDIHGLERVALGRYIGK